MTCDELKKWLLDWDMTRDQFAKHIGVSRRTVQRWVTGEKRIPKVVELFCQQAKR